MDQKIKFLLITILLFLSAINYLQDKNKILKSEILKLRQEIFKDEEIIKEINLSIDGSSSSHSLGQSNSSKVSEIKVNNDISDANVWLKCLNEIQSQQVDQLKYILTSKELGLHVSSRQRKKILFISQEKSDNNSSFSSSFSDILSKIGSLKFLKKFGFGLNEIEIRQIPTTFDFDIIEDFSKFSIAILQGGSHWGDLWNYQNLQKTKIELIIKTLLRQNIPIISFPNSLYYQNKTVQKIDTENLKNIVYKSVGLLNGPKYLTLCWKQLDSFEVASEELYKFANNVLVSDVSFMIGPVLNEGRFPTFNVEIKRPIFDILFLLRDDRESSLILKDMRCTAFGQDHSDQNLKCDYEKFIKNILANIGRDDITFLVSDWNGRHEIYTAPSSDKNSNKLDSIQSATTFLSAAKIIITDRLQASLLAFLKFQPHVFIDQIYGKIGKSREVAFRGSESCGDGSKLRYGSAENLVEGIEKALYMLE